MDLLEKAFGSPSVVKERLTKSAFSYFTPLYDQGGWLPVHFLAELPSLSHFSAEQLLEMAKNTRYVVSLCEKLIRQKPKGQEPFTEYVLGVTGFPLDAGLAEVQMYFQRYASVSHVQFMGSSQGLWTVDSEKNDDPKPFYAVFIPDPDQLVHVLSLDHLYEDSTLSVLPYRIHPAPLTEKKKKVDYPLDRVIRFAVPSEKIRKHAILTVGNQHASVTHVDLQLPIRFAYLRLKTSNAKALVDILNRVGEPIMTEYGPLSEFYALSGEEERLYWAVTREKDRQQSQLTVTVDNFKKNTASPIKKSKRNRRLASMKGKGRRACVPRAAEPIERELDFEINQHGKRTLNQRIPTSTNKNNPKRRIIRQPKRTKIMSATDRMLQGILGDLSGFQMADE
jgi:hypothetical protein